MTFQPGNDLDIWDVAITKYGASDGIAWLLVDNPSLIDGLGAVNLSDSIEVRNDRPTETAAKTKSAAPAPVVNAPEAMGITRQSVWDVAIQYYGDARGIAWLLADNPGLVLDAGLVAGGRISYSLRKTIINRAIWDKLIDEFPITGKRPGGPWVTEDNEEWITDDGTEWWTE